MMNPYQYGLYSDISKYHVSYIISEFAEQLKNVSGNCLNISCATGEITNNLILPALDPNTIITGIDVSKSMIEYANETYNKKQLKFELFDIQTKNLPQKYISKFHHIFLFNTLHWNNIWQTFQNIYQILRPGGTMLISFVVSHAIFDIFQILIQDTRYASYMMSTKKFILPFQNSVEPHMELKNLLICLGFDIDHISHREITYPDKNLNQYFTAVTSIIPFPNEMPLELKEEFKKDLEREYMPKRFINKSEYNNQELMLDIHKLLIVHARKGA